MPKASNLPCASFSVASDTASVRITPKTGEVVCEGKIVHKGRTLAVSEATLKDVQGKLLAFGTETCSIFPAANLAAR